MREAESQIARILRDSTRQHGPEASRRYAVPLLAAMEAVGDVPGRLGAGKVPRQPGIYAYPARLVRNHVDPAYGVRFPRHLIVYRVADDTVIDIPGWCMTGRSCPEWPNER